MDDQFRAIDARFTEMDAKFERVLSEIFRIGVLVEEQNNRNRFVLDGYASLYERQERFEATMNRRMDGLEEIIRSWSKSKGSV